jgi:hypothetical protein
MIKKLMMVTRSTTSDTEDRGVRASGVSVRVVTLAPLASLQAIPEILSYGNDISCSSYLQLMINQKWIYVELLSELHQFHESCLWWWWWCGDVHSDELERVASDVKDTAWVSQQTHIAGNSFKIILIHDIIKHRILKNAFTCVFTWEIIITKTQLLQVTQLNAVLNLIQLIYKSAKLITIHPLTHKSNLNNCKF